MKHMKFAATIVAPVVMVVISCSGVNEEEMNARQRELHARVENSINDLELAISQTEDEIEMADDSVKALLQRQLTDLELSRDALKERLDKIGSTADSEWASFRQSVDSLLTRANLVLEGERDTPS